MIAAIRRLCAWLWPPYALEYDRWPKGDPARWPKTRSTHNAD